MTAFIQFFLDCVGVVRLAILGISVVAGIRADDIGSIVPSQNGMDQPAQHMDTHRRAQAAGRRADRPTAQATPGSRAMRSLAQAPRCPHNQLLPATASPPLSGSIPSTP
ncbi:hypothetical protein EI94DRAFT_1812234 [Lactarius quietus]|nr:hypothetical protein EI94DRAFT_1812234 [Lactarius quietus]